MTVSVPGVPMSTSEPSRKPCRPAGVVEVEDDPLALAQHAEDRPLERVGGEVVVGEVGVAHHDAEPGPRVVGLDDTLHAGRALLVDRAPTAGCQLPTSRP